MPIVFDRVHVRSAGCFLPGEPVGNERMDDYIAPLDRASERIKRRILAENGIRTRHYAIDTEGRTVHTNAAMAAQAVRDCLGRAGAAMAEVSMLATGSSGGDLLMPGFANMVQGELAAPPMETLSVHGICGAGVGAIQAAALAVQSGAHAQALAVASEMPSRLFKRSRFAARGYDADFDAHFLRWMLSDGAGALLLGLDDGQGCAGAPGLRLALRWIHQRSFSGDYPPCMQMGLTADRRQAHLDFPSWSEAEAAGALALRQDIRLLPHLFDIGIHEFARLVRDGWFQPEGIDHFLCHYSSEKFAPVVESLMVQAGLSIPRERWWNNLAWRGNTGAASILVMLSEFLQLRGRELRPGQRLLCYVPESGRFSTAYLLFEVEEAGAAPAAAAGAGTPVPAPARPAASPGAPRDSDAIAPPHDPAHAPAGLGPLLTELAAIWHDYRSQVWRTPLVRAIRERRFATADYLRWMGHWVPQVREGSRWMREGAASLGEAYAPLAALIGVHAGEEQEDFRILFEDYRTAGGDVAELDRLRRNPGGEALNAYLHALAAERDPIGLLGAIYIIEGTGQRIVPALLPLLKAALPLPPQAFRFLEYHGQNDEHHLARWLQAVGLALDLGDAPAAAGAIADTARRTAMLYLMQFQHAGPPGPH